MGDSTSMSKGAAEAFTLLDFEADGHPVHISSRMPAMAFAAGTPVFWLVVRGSWDYLDYFWTCVDENIYATGLISHSCVINRIFALPVDSSQSLLSFQVLHELGRIPFILHQVKTVALSGFRVFGRNPFSVRGFYSTLPT